MPLSLSIIVLGILGFLNPMSQLRRTDVTTFYVTSVLNLQSRNLGYSGGLLGFNSELTKESNEWGRAVMGS